MTRSSQWFERARRVSPGGVHSPVRAMRAVGGTPLFIQRARGAYLIDADGRRLIDMCGSWGPLILGHADPAVVKAVQKTAANGMSFGVSNPLEVQLAEEIVGAVPSIESVRFVSSGTEAVMSAIRLARAATGRTKIIKFKGGYHGHSDGLLVASGSGALTLGLGEGKGKAVRSDGGDSTSRVFPASGREVPAIPSSAGIPGSFAKETIVAEYNDLNSVEKIFKAQGADIAAVIVEPIAGNMGVILPKPGFLKGLHALTRKNKTLLIFDEVITGFRVGYGGVQKLTGITPDLTTLGKIIGGGLPVGAFGGSQKLMNRLAPEGDVYQAGTLSGNPVAMAAGLATLQKLKNGKIYRSLEAGAARLEDALHVAADRNSLPIRINREGSMMTLFFAKEPVTGLASAKRSDTQQFSRFFNGMLARGIYWPPSQFEAFFISAAHDAAVLTLVISAANAVFADI